MRRMENPETLDLVKKTGECLATSRLNWTTKGQIVERPIVMKLLAENHSLRLDIAIHLFLVTSGRYTWDYSKYYSSPRLNWSNSTRCLHCISMNILPGLLHSKIALSHSMEIKDNMNMNYWMSFFFTF